MPRPRPLAYAPLWAKSNYSFLEGASHPEELAEECVRQGLPSLALTDRDGVYGIVRAFVKARELGLHLIYGAQVTVGTAPLPGNTTAAVVTSAGQPTPTSIPTSMSMSTSTPTSIPTSIPTSTAAPTEPTSHLVLLAQDRRGYANLCQLLSTGRLRCEKGESRVTWTEVCQRHEGLIALWGGPGSLLVEEADPLFIARDLKDAFGDRLYAMITRHRQAEDAERERRTRERADRFHLPIVAAHEVLYHTPARRRLHDVLTCIRHGVDLASAGRRIKPNAEHALKPPHAFAMLFGDDPDAIVRTFEVAERCAFSLTEIRYRYPAEKLPDGTTSAEWLRDLTYSGAFERYPDGIPGDVDAQLQKELQIVNDLEYDGYFLTMWEIVQFCRRQGILCQGRGSAANSAVCYCLGITAIDPVRMGLLFERFMSKERAEPPDIDLDIEHERREEVIQYVYEKYGRTHAAMVANFIRYRARSAIREVGKALGFAETEIDRVAKLLPYFESIDANTLREAGLDPQNPTHQLLLQLTHEIQDFPRHLSIHPGGFLLGHEPVGDLVPIENATMDDRTVIQWDKDDLENLGLFKVDLLGLGALTQLHYCFNLLREHHGIRQEMATIPPNDGATFEMIRRADTVGVFQIESRAQMAMLPRLKPRTYYDLVIEVSIVRPGPISGGMVHPYLRRRNGEEEVVYPHESLRPVLQKTLGVPLFQEQVMQLAVVAADYTPGEADQLRRDMAAWRSSGRIERHQERLIRRMIEKGIEPEFAERVFNQIRGFGEYGFPESHAASFALIAYATAWFRCHHPEIFTCALLNAQPMGFYAPATLVDDAKRLGVQVLPIDIRRSRWDCVLEPFEDVFALRLGYRYIKGLGESEGRRIEAAAAEGPFRSIEDFADRTRLEPHDLQKLAESGAFEGFDTRRRNALWTVRGLQRPHHPAETRIPISSTGGDAETNTGFAPLSLFDEIGWDYDTQHLSTRGHPLAPLRLELAAQGLPDARTVSTMKNGRRIRFAGIAINRQRPGTAGGVTFMTLEDETGFVNLVVWQKVFEKHKLLAKSLSFVGVTGKLQVESGVTHLIVDAFWKPQVQTQPKKTTSRDFH